MVLYSQTFFDNQLDILVFFTEFLIFKVQSQSKKNNSVILSVEEMKSPLVQSLFKFVHQQFRKIVTEQFEVFRENIFNYPKVYELIVKLMTVESSICRNDWLLTCFLNEFEAFFSFYDLRFIIVSIVQKISFKSFSNELATHFMDLLCDSLHYQAKLVDFPELYILTNITLFHLHHSRPLDRITVSQQKDKSETLNLDLLKGFFRVFVVVATWTVDSLSSSQFENLFQAIFGLLKFHFILAPEDNLLLLIGLFEKIQKSRTFIKEVAIKVKDLLSNLTVSNKYFPLFTLGLKHLLLVDQVKGFLNKGYYKCFKDFLYTVSEHVKKGQGLKLFYHNTLIREVFTLVKLINSKSSLREQFDFMNPSRNFIYSLMDDEQVLKRDVIRLLDEDLLIIEFNCAWDYCSDFLSHLRKLCDYSLSQQHFLEWKACRSSPSFSPQNVSLGLLGVVTSQNLFELDSIFRTAQPSEEQRITSLNELIQVDSQIFRYPQKNVLLLQLSVKNITKILVKKVSLQIHSKELQIYPEVIVIGLVFFSNLLDDFSPEQIKRFWIHIKSNHFCLFSHKG